MGAISTYTAMTLDEIARKGRREADRFGNGRTRTFSSDSPLLFFSLKSEERLFAGSEMVKRKPEV